MAKFVMKLHAKLPATATMAVFGLATFVDAPHIKPVLCIASLKSRHTNMVSVAVAGCFACGFMANFANVNTALVGMNE